MSVKTKLIESLKEHVKDAQFMLVELKGGEMIPVYDGDGQLMTFKDGAGADACAKSLSATRDVKIQPRRITDKDWRAREQKKMEDGTYRLLPWAKEAWWAELATIHREHFPHVSTQKASLVAITESEAAGSADIQTSMRIGRYLERYFSEQLNKFLIRDLATVFAKANETNDLQFATDAEDIEDVYMNGPNSCMSKDATAYRTKEHPTRAYAAGDIAVAFLRRGGKITARCVCCPEKKTFNTIYGDRGLMEPLMRKAGFKQGYPVGAKLLKIPSADKETSEGVRYVVPHIDGIPWVKSVGDHWVTGDPNKNCDAEGGVLIPSGGGLTEYVAECKGCQNVSPSRIMPSIYTTDTGNETQRRCQKCAKAQAVQCAVSGYYVLKDCALQLANGCYFWKRYVSKGNKQVQACAGNGKYYMTNEMIALPDGRMWSQEYWQAAGAYCDKCGTRVERGYVCDMKCKNDKPKGVVDYYTTMTGGGSWGYSSSTGGR